MDKDYDSYELNNIDTARIKPLTDEIKEKELNFKYFISSVYWTPTPYDVVQKHNKEIRRTIRSFFKEDVRMWFFIEKHLDASTPSFGGFSRHILLEDAPASRWRSPSTRMQGILMQDVEQYFACIVGDGLTDDQKVELLKKLLRKLPFIPNGQRGLDIRTIHNLEKLTAYCSKQFEKVLPSYEVLDPVSSDIEPSFLINYKQDGTEWKPRHQNISHRTHRSLRPTHRKQPEQGFSVV